MTWRVDKIQLIAIAVFRIVMESDALSLDSNTALTLNIEGVQNLGIHLPLFKTTAV